MVTVKLINNKVILEFKFLGVVMISFMNGKIYNNIHCLIFLFVTRCSVFNRWREEGRQLRKPGGCDRGLVHVPGGAASAHPGVGHPLAAAEEERETRRRLHRQLQQVARIALLHEQALRAWRDGTWFRVRFREHCRLRTLNYFMNVTLSACCEEGMWFRVQLWNFAGFECWIATGTEDVMWNRTCFRVRF